MSTESPICAKCGSRMDEGFVLDRGDLEVRHPASWVSGPPQKSLWLGTKLAGRETLQISSYRCTACGFLESYARSTPA